MNKSCKYCDYTYPGHTSSQHHEPPEMQMCDLISKVVVSGTSNESIVKNILQWVIGSEPQITAVK
ncbi:hypothetical protein LCGC14_2287800 [marine sediment metagenome]|uniref:Uncharacterized protein n=1 Tax=marine sediment metagenome TaxID=412755 RepID=A0A0F9CRZ7_9ZZZZ